MCTWYVAVGSTASRRLSNHTTPSSRGFPVDFFSFLGSQLAGCGSTFYASGYDSNGNKDGLVMMQTLSGVTVDDSREVVAVVRPGKYPAGSSVSVEARHVVDKPSSLDWERAAMLPFLVRRGDTGRPCVPATDKKPGDICSVGFRTSDLVRCCLQVGALTGETKREIHECLQHLEHKIHKWGRFWRAVFRSFMT